MVKFTTYENGEPTYWLPVVELPKLMNTDATKPEVYVFHVEDAEQAQQVQVELKDVLTTLQEKGIVHKNSVIFTLPKQFGIERIEHTGYELAHILLRCGYKMTRKKWLDGHTPYKPYLVWEERGIMHDPNDGRVRMLWCISQEDLTADDWMLLDIT